MTFIKEIKSLFFVVAAVGMWSILYPELVFHPDVCRVVEENAMTDTESDSAKETAQEVQTSADSSEKLYDQLFETDRQNIRLKSWLWENWMKWRAQR